METKSKNWWLVSIEDVCREFNTNLVRGLSSEDAAKLLETIGLNRLPEQKKTSVLALFFNQFVNVIVLVLIGAAVVSGLLGEWTDSVSISAIIIINALIGFFQEYGAESSLAALRSLIQPSARVMRDGVLQNIEASALVPGDVIILSLGDRVPTDGRVIYTAQLATQEAALTGESTPVEKTIESLPEQELSIGDRKNMVFAGTIVVRGNGTIIVTETGLRTELGKVSSMLQVAVEPKTPLQIRLDELGRSLLVKSLFIILIIFFAELLRSGDIMTTILTALSLAVAAIPEGLPAITTVALALGVKRMVKRNALIRHLTSVETLGCTTVICTDKTGTLTQNEMVIRRIWVNDEFIEVTGTGYAPMGTFQRGTSIINPQEYSELMFALKIGALCNTASLYEENEQWLITGDPTEGSILTVAQKANITKQALERESTFIAEIPFDPDRKRMSVVREVSGKRILFVKGASDVILQHSSEILIDGKPLLLTEEYRAKATEAISTFSNQALRVLGFAYRYLNPTEKINVELEKQLVFVGFVGMIDPPRPEAKESIEKCRQAGIRVIMITGDHKETAVAIAQELGLMNQSSIAVSGTELEHMDDAELLQKIRTIAVYARVSVEQKIRIVKAWKSLGEIVAMTGDGVNDAPAIKAADIGVAMGLTGTEVTKEAADMVIADDNFASIVSAVEEGRGIYDNILKFVYYLFSANISEILVIFAANLLGFRDPTGAVFVCLMPIQLLWLNLITDGFPAIALSVDPLDPGIMNRPPRTTSEAILSPVASLRLGIFGLIMAIGGLIVCHIGLRQNAHTAHTMVLSIFVVLEFVRLMQIRSQYHIGFFSNKWLVGSLAVSFLLHMGILYTPLMQRIFGTVPLSLYEWSTIFGVVALVFAASLMVQFLFKRFSTRTI